MAERVRYVELCVSVGGQLGEEGEETGREARNYFGGHFTAILLTWGRKGSEEVFMEEFLLLENSW